MVDPGTTLGFVSEYQGEFSTLLLVDDRGLRTRIELRPAKTEEGPYGVRLTILEVEFSVPSISELVWTMLIRFNLQCKVDLQRLDEAGPLTSEIETGLPSALYQRLLELGELA